MTEEITLYEFRSNLDKILADFEIYVEKHKLQNLDMHDWFYELTSFLKDKEEEFYL